MEVTLDLHTRKLLCMELMQTFKDEGLLLIPKEQGPAILLLHKKQQALLKKKAITAYQVVTYGLLPNVTTVQTIYNMVKDGRIKENVDYFYSKGNKLHLLTETVKRLRDE